jgi:hypothetical protein
MSLLKFVGNRDDINKIILGGVDLPLTSSILKKELIKVSAIVNDTDDLDQILNNPEEPLNILYRMHPINGLNPQYIKDERINEIQINTRGVILGEQINVKGKITLNYDCSRHGELELSGRFERNFKKNDVVENAWSSIFTHNLDDRNVKFLVPKSNSIILNDSYLFGKTNEKLGMFNVKRLLRAIMPDECLDEFQITIITADCHWSPNFAEQKFNELLDFLNSEFNYSVFLELVIWGASKSINHKRMLISNYYTVVADCGFGLFNEKNMTTNTNDVVVKRIFHDADQPGDSPYQQSNFRLELMRKTYYAAKEFCRNTSPSVGCIFLNSGDFEKRNRLFIFN